MESKNQLGVEADHSSQKFVGFFSRKSLNFRKIQLQNDIEQKYKLLDHIQESTVEQEK